MARVGVVRRHLRRPGQPHRPPAGALRHRGAEAAVPAEAAVRRDGRRLLPQRDRLRLRRPRREDHAPPGRPTAASSSTARRCGSPTAASPTSSSSSPRSDGEQFTRLHRRAGVRGVTSGKEEHKMGLHGSSTTPIILQDVQVPAENLLGEVGKGHKVAFNVLNFGRFKLGAMCVRRRRVARSARRRAYAGDAQAVRPADRVVRRHQAQARRDDRPHLRGRKPALPHRRHDRRADRGDAARGHRPVRRRSPRSRSTPSKRRLPRSPAARRSTTCSTRTSRSTAATASSATTRPSATIRDARVNRIFEGTNEINRLLIPGMLARRARQGRDLPSSPAAKALQDELLAPPSLALADDGDSCSPTSGAPSTSFKKAALMVLGLAMQTYGAKLTDEQEVLMHLADIADRRLRRRKRACCGPPAAARRAAPRAALHVDAARVFVNDARHARRRVGAAGAGGDRSTATRCARCWRRCAACSSRAGQHRGARAGNWPTRPSRAAGTIF